MVLKTLRQFTLFLSVISLHAQESAFERLSLNKLNSTFNHGDHVQTEHGTGKVLFNYDFKCELSSRGMVFRPRIMVQPAAKTNANYAGTTYVDYKFMQIWEGSTVAGAPIHILQGGFSTLENNLYVQPNGSIVTSFIHDPNHYPPPEAVGFNFNADSTSVGSINPGGGNWSNYGRGFMLPDGKPISIPMADDHTRVVKENIQDYLPLLQVFGYPSSQVSRGGGDTVPDTLKENCYKLESGGLAFFLKDDAGKEGYYGPFENTYLKLLVDGVTRDGWLPALVLITSGQEAYEYELVGPSEMHNEVRPEVEGTSYDLVMGAAGYRLRKIKNKFGDYIKFEYDVEDIGYTARLFINGVDSGKAISLIYQGKNAGVNPPLFGHLSANLPTQADTVLNLALRSTANGTVLKTYSLSAAFQSGFFEIVVDKPNPPKRERMQFLSIKDESDGLLCEIKYAQLKAFLPIGPGMTVGAVAIDSIQFSNGLKYQFAYKPDLYTASFGTWNTSILGGDNSGYSNWFPGMSWGISELQTTDTLAAETRTTRYERRIPELKAHPYLFQLNSSFEWNSTEFWEKETYPDGSGVKRIFVSPVPGYLGGAPLFSPLVGGDPYPVRLQMYLFKKAALEKAEYFDTAGTTYKIVSHETWENRNLYNPNADPTLGMDAHPTRTVTALITEGVTSTRAFAAWDAVNIGWTRMDHTIAGPGGSFNRGASWTLQSNPPYGLFGQPKGEVRPGYPAITRTFDSTGLVTSEQAVGGTLQLKKDFQIAQGRVKGFTLTGTGLGGSPSTSSLAYEYDALGYMNKISAGGGLLTYLRNSDPEGRPTQDTDPNGFAVSYQWDGANRLKGITPGGEVGSLVNYPTDLRSLNLSRGQISESRKFNAFGELISVQRPGGTQTFRYDRMGRKTFESVIGGVNGTSFSYDARGRLNSLTDPNGLLTTTTYSGLNKTVALGGNATTLGYDPLGRLAAIVDAKGQRTEYSYDEGDRILEVRQIGEAGTQRRNWTYNALGWVTSLVQPESGTTTYSAFNVQGKPTVTNYAGRVVRTAFDTLGRITSVSADDGSVTQSFTYDIGTGAKGKLVQSKDGAATLTYAYTGLNGRLGGLSTTLPIGAMGTPQTFSQGFIYDTYGHLSSATLPSGRSTSYTYDLTRDVLKDLSAPAGTPGAFGASGMLARVTGFNEANMPTGLAYGNGASTLFGYGFDQMRLSTMAHYKPGAGSPLKQWIYQWDPAKGLLKGDGEDAYTYDELGRLKSVDMAVPGSPSRVSQSYDYDAFGNQVSSVALGSYPPWINNFTFSKTDAAWMQNRIPGVAANGAFTGVTYSPQGNLTSLYKRMGDTGKQISMIYDALGRVSQMGDSERGVVEKYAYTPEGLRWKSEEYLYGTLKKIRYNLYNDARQLVSQYEWLPTNP